MYNLTPPSHHNVNRGYKLTIEHTKSTVADTACASDTPGMDDNAEHGPLGLVFDNRSTSSLSSASLFKIASCRISRHFKAPDSPYNNNEM